MSDLRTERLAALKEMLAAREGQPGFEANVEAIKAQIAELESGETNYRSGATGRFVNLEHLIANPETTVRS